MNTEYVIIKNARIHLKSIKGYYATKDGISNLFVIIVLSHSMKMYLSDEETEETINLLDSLLKPIQLTDTLYM